MRPYKPKKKRAYHNLGQLKKEMIESRHRVLDFDGHRITTKHYYYLLAHGEIVIEKIEDALSVGKL